MKTRNGIATLLLAAAVLTQPACYGKFALTKKVYDLNGSISGNKFIQSILTWVFIILPVYGIAGFADFVILNVIEFWTGSNPMASTKTVDGVTVATRTTTLDGVSTLEITQSENGHVIRTARIAKLQNGLAQASVLNDKGNVVETRTFAMSHVSAETVGMLAY